MRESGPAQRVCRICGNSRGSATYLFREMMVGYREEFEYFQCGDCECLQISRFPGDMRKYYPDEYYSFQPDRRRSGLMGWLRRERNRCLVFSGGPVGNLVNRWSPNEALRSLHGAMAQRTMRILDVGSGAGNLLCDLSDLGFGRLVGVDPNVSQSIEYANGVRILKGTIDSVEGEWDLVMFHHSFEHLPNPLETLVQVSRLLSSGGVCLIRTPTVTSLAWEYYRTDWVQADAPRHFFVHSKKSMEVLAGKAGFSVVGIVCDSNAFQFWGSEQYRADIPLLSPRSHAMSPRASLFSAREIRRFQRQAVRLNREGRGDAVAYYLRRRYGPEVRPRSAAGDGREREYKTATPTGGGGHLWQGRFQDGRQA